MSAVRLPAGGAGRVLRHAQAVDHVPRQRRCPRPQLGEGAGLPAGQVVVSGGGTLLLSRQPSQPGVRLRYERWPGRWGRLAGPLLLLLQQGGRRLHFRPGLRVLAPFQVNCCPARAQILQALPDVSGQCCHLASRSPLQQLQV